MDPTKNKEFRFPEYDPETVEMNYVMLYRLGQQNMQQRCYNVANMIGGRDCKNCIEELPLMKFGDPIPESDEDLKGWI